MTLRCVQPPRHFAGEHPERVLAEKGVVRWRNNWLLCKQCLTPRGTTWRGGWMAPETCTCSRWRSARAAINASNPWGCTDPFGTVLSYDQRGYRRPVGGRCDMGAFEAWLDVLLPLVVR